MRNCYLIFYFLLVYSSGFCQTPEGAVFGGFHNATPEIRDKITPQQREIIYMEIKSNIRKLASRGITPQSTLRDRLAVQFILPLRQAAGFNDPGFYGISGYVDIDTSAGIGDYNCGTRTYDGHLGTDFYTFPFYWTKKDQDAVEIVAAADGIIVAKRGNLQDTSCAMCPAGAPQSCWNWNAVYLQHADGTLSMYGHMKQNSLTSKTVGDAVVAGEFLGIVGSSGNSSGPHLHFEVWTDTNFTKLIHPWAGACNPDGSASFWSSQENYHMPSINKVYSAASLPSFSQCYMGGTVENSREKDTFNLGETVYLIAFARDNVPGGSSYQISLTGPGGTPQYNWSLSPFNGFYTTAWFYYYYGPPTINKVGDWTYTVQYGSNQGTTHFYVQGVAPLHLIDFMATANNGSVRLQWTTEEEMNTAYFSLERSRNGIDFISVGALPTKGNGSAGHNQYSFTDPYPPSGTLYYRLKMVDKDEQFSYSPVEKIRVDGKSNVIMYPNPAGNSVSFSGVKEYHTLVITGMNGQVVLQQSIKANLLDVDISRLHPGVYIVLLENEGTPLRLKLMKN